MPYGDHVIGKMTDYSTQSQGLDTALISANVL